ncbi:MAG TPA: hypothetical protein VK914_13205 [bacterium]|nr:hypothetical protein [bacterium]
MARDGYRPERIRRAERMDAAGTGALERQAALQGLDRISRWPGQRAPLLRGLAALLGKPAPRVRRLVEVGAGSGRLASWVGLRLRALGHRVEVIATDREACEGVSKMDALARPLPEADIYFSNLLLHHLDDADVRTMFGLQAAASRVGLLHCDLHRHWAHFHGAGFFLRAARMPDIILEDGAGSIQQGFTRRELEALALGLPAAQVDWTFPFRWMLTWRRS